MMVEENSRQGLGFIDYKEERRKKKDKEKGTKTGKKGRPK